MLMFIIIAGFVTGALFTINASFGDKRAKSISRAGWIVAILAVAALSYLVIFVDVRVHDLKIRIHYIDGNVETRELRGCSYPQIRSRFGNYKLTTNNGYILGAYRYEVLEDSTYILK